MTGGPLAGRRIVVTRAREQAEGLAARIRAAGGEPIVFPALEIRSLEDLQPFYALADRLESFDLAIFISPTAVDKAMNLLRRRRGAKPWPAGLRVAAIGRGSRRELERQGFRDVLAPGARADSEALLALPELSTVPGKRVVIFRGEGGRELLGDMLAARGAAVQYAECYRRARPDADAGALLAAWARGAVHAVTVSSAEGLANLFEMLGTLGREWLKKTPLVVPHERVAEEAARLGVREVRVSGPGDDEVVAALVAYFAARR
jgi:uroporphyrinogen-III synthase